MLRYLLAFALVAATLWVGYSILSHLFERGAPTPLDISLASGIYTVVIAARVTL